MKPLTNQIKIGVLLFAFVFIKQHSYAQISPSDFVIKVDLNIATTSFTISNPLPAVTYPAFPAGQFQLGGTEPISYVRIYDSTGTTLLHDYSVGATNGQLVNEADDLDHDWMAAPYNGVVKIAYSNDITIVTNLHPLDDLNNPTSTVNSKIKSVDQWGTANYSFISFYGAQNMDVLATDIPNLTDVTSLNNTFHYCQSLLNTNGSIGLWLTDSITEMANMFRNASSFNGDLSNWNVERVTTFSGTFDDATVFDNNGNDAINNWNVENCIDFSTMFRHANSFNRNISSWQIDTINSVVMSQMFFGASIFNKDISTWNVKTVTHMDNMFRATNEFNQDISAWNVSSVINMSQMFNGAVKFENGTNSAVNPITGRTGINGWDVSSVTNFSHMFRSTIFNRELKDWNTTSLNTMNNMFLSATKFNQDISTWDVSGVSNFTQVFRGATEFNNGANNLTNSNTGRLGLNGWDVSGATNFSRMFESARDFDRDIGDWTINTSSNVNMHRVFYQAISFNQNINDWDVSMVNTMLEMFDGASSYNQSMANWNVSNVTNFVGFLDLSGLSINSYDELLIGWANQDLADGVIIGVQGLEYCIGVAARDNLESSQSITFDGDARQCATGGYSNNAIFWQSAGSVSGVTNGGDVTQWLDLSSANNSFTATNAPTLNTTDVINFHPVLDFNGTNDVMSNTPFSAVPTTFERIQNTSFFVVYKEEVREDNRAFMSFNSAGANDFYTHYAPNSSNQYVFAAQESAITTVSPTTDPLNPAYIDTSLLDPDSFNVSRTATHQLGEATVTQFTHFYGASNGVGLNSTNTIYQNNRVLQPADVIANADDGRFARTTDIFLGGADGSSDFFRGDIAEVIAFQANPNSIERRAINTYFAIKYSIQMDMDYLASDQSTVIWDFDGINSAYHNGVFGIGRDDGGALNQKVSKSSNADAILTIATASNFDSLNNSVSRPSLSRDSTYLVMGHNASLDTVWTSVGAPEDFQIIGRNWKIQITGNLEDSIYLQFDVDDADFDIPNGNQSSVYYVVVDSDNDGDFSNNTPTLLSNTSGSLWSGVVELSNGNIFTLSTPFTNSPGGELDFLNAWYKADAGTLDSFNVSETVNGEEVYIWKSQFGDSTKDLIVEKTDQNGPVPTAPKYGSHYLNYNPGLGFDRGSDRFINNVDGAIFGVDDMVFYMVSYFESSDGLFYNQGLNSNSDFRITSNTVLGNGFRGVTLDSAFNLEQDGIFRLVRDEITASTFGGSKAFNGDILQSEPAHSGTVREARTQSFGGDFRTSVSSFDERIAEMIIYTGNITEFPNHSKVESYLALKYGLTLNQSVNSGSGQDYLASDSSAIWDASTSSTGFNNDIFGIGTDETSGLFQKISNSINHDGIVILSLNENLVVNNQDSLRTETLTDLNFLTIANNDSALNWEDNPSDRIFNCVCSYAFGMKRIWEVTEVTTTGVADSLNDVYVGIPSNRLGRDSLPSVGNDPLTNLEPNRGFSTLYLLVDSNSGSDFTNNTFRYYEMELDSDGIYRTTEKVDLNDNDRFTFSFVRNPSRLRHGKDVLFDRRIRTYRVEQ